MRHGDTDLSPQPEGWQQVSLNKSGWAQARHAAEFLRQYIAKGHPKPDWGVSSDLLRTQETLAIMAEFLRIPIYPCMESLRAYESTQETPLHYEERNLMAFTEIFKHPGIPLIVAHRSSTGFLGKYHKVLAEDPDYRYDALLLEGGIMAWTDTGIIPLFRVIEKNWPEHPSKTLGMSIAG